MFGPQSRVEQSPARKSSIFFKIIADSLEHIYQSENAPSTLLYWAKWPRTRAECDSYISTVGTES